MMCANGEVIVGDRVRCISSRHKTYAVDGIEVAPYTSFAVLDDGRKVPAFALSVAWKRIGMKHLDPQTRRKHVIGYYMKVMDPNDALDKACMAHAGSAMCRNCICTSHNGEYCDVVNREVYGD